jgi:hypothetical protein
LLCANDTMDLTQWERPKTTVGEMTRSIVPLLIYFVNIFVWTPER